MPKPYVINLKFLYSSTHFCGDAGENALHIPLPSLYVCMYVCIYVFMHVYTYVSMYTRTYVCMYVRT